MPDAPTAPAPLLLTSRQCAAMLQICEKSLWALTKAGRLPVCRINRSVRYDRRDVLAFVEASKAPPEARA